MPNETDRLIQSAITDDSQSIEEEISADVLSISSPIVPPLDDLVRDVVEARAKKRKKLAVFIETEGGYISIVERMVDTIRHHYEVVEFYVLTHAMSAGTVFVMSGDAIHMDYYSLLGPIDPQIPKGDTLIPAFAYLRAYEDLIEKAQSGALSSAEFALLDKFDLGEIYTFREEFALTIELLETWLAKYKFKDWSTTEDRGVAVTDTKRHKRAEEIAHKLNKHNHWHSHGRGIPMKRLREELKLKIDDFGQNKEFSARLRRYFATLLDYQQKTNSISVIHSQDMFLIR